MPAFGQYLEEKILDHVLAGVAYPPPAAHFVSLHTAAPSATGTPSNEVSGGSYSRQVATFGQSALASGVYTAANSGNIAFTGMPAVTVVAVAIYDGPNAATGNLLFYGTLASSVIVAAGGTFVINTGSLTVTIS